ncbi:bactofilin family protein [Solimicrobium silvestre]|uniref:Integral membrane protein CcmA involved in cell shape determination n=1 Tax=Solimicrobium silvestre TaxID=2099400 RepID=A0A2S9H113_9BURK|nr:polymer-forming cytoskeletal protein [Solimicrobium silvestre]PRC93669.1 Integral membrane protein CcmA involved in cell shape determination [Solimicrobium silvestre]
MFNRKNKSTIDSLIGLSTNIDGNLYFKGGLRIDGSVKGNVIAEDEHGSMLIISENAMICGEVRAAHIVVDGSILGPVFSSELLELLPKARITGDVHYKALEMNSGATVTGQLTHTQTSNSTESVLQLSSSQA